jgi:hypothetical protein
MLERHRVDNMLADVTSPEHDLDPMTSRIENGVEYKSMAWWYVSCVLSSSIVLTGA